MGAGTRRFEIVFAWHRRLQSESWRPKLAHGRQMTVFPFEKKIFVAKPGQLRLFLLIHDL